MRASRGFTLLELLIALGIFGLISVMAYGGLKVVLDAREQTAEQSARLAELERTLLFLSRDVIQAVDRPVRDELGDPLPALQGGEGSDGLELTRGGWANPAGVPRSSLQRVTWSLTEERLVRAAWPVLDRAQDSNPHAVTMLQGVTDIEVRFLGPDRKWADSWPPPIEAPPAMPLGLSVSLELEDWGTVTRLWSLPGGGS